MNWLQTGMIALLVALAGYVIMDNRNLKETIKAKDAQLDATVAEFRAAQAKAEAEALTRLNEELARVAETNESTLNAYHRDIDSLRDTAQRLQIKPAAPTEDRSAAEPVCLSAAGVPTIGTEEACATVQLPADDARIANEQAIQLGRLLDWFDDIEKGR